MYKEYLAEFWYSTKALENSMVFFSAPTGGIYGEVGVNTFINAIGAHYLSHSSEYVAPLSIDIVRPWFEIIGYGEAVPAKRTLKKSLLPPRWSLANGINIDYASIFWEDIIIKLNKKHRKKVALKPNQPKEPPFTDYMLAICAANMPVVFKAPKTSSKAESVSQGTKPKAKPRHKKLSTSSKQPFVSNSKATKGGSFKAPTSSKTSHSKKRKESSSAIDSNPSQPSTLVDTRIHKEDQQATSSLTSLGVTTSFVVYSEFASRCDASADSTAKADPELSAPRTGLHVLADKTKSISKGLETVLTQPITGNRASSIARQVEEDEASKTIKLEDLEKLVSIFLNLRPYQPSPHSLVSKELEPEKNKAKAEVALLKAQPSFPNVEQLNEILIELPGDLKEIPPKLDNFTKTVTSLASQVAELKTLQWELPTEFLSLPKQVKSVQAKLKILDALPSLLLNITQALNKFAQVLDSASSKAGDQSSSQPEGEHIKKDKGKKAMSSKDAEEVSTESDFDDETIYVTGSFVESSKKKDLKKFDFVTKDGEHVHLTEEQISPQKKIEEEAKAEAARREGELRKEELIDLLGP
ncbi:hypothetical protein Tco_1354298 [Tanacetum coccineum]